MTVAAETKRARETPTIGTHDGSFHCDEVLGCALLHRTARFANADVVRTRDPAKLAECDIVIDVSGECVPESMKFDHHQRSFTETFSDDKTLTRLSSAGLVYKHFGKEILAKAVEGMGAEADVETLFPLVYDKFVEAVDAIDNGVSQYDTDAPSRYVNNTGLASRVGSLNPSWNEESTPEIQMERFAKGMEIAYADFENCVRYLVRSWLPARAIIEEAVEGRTSVHPSGKIIKLSTVAPWKEHLFQVEEAQGIAGETLYVLYQDSRGGWRVQCVPPSLGSFACRKALPEPWRGVRDDALSEATGIEGCIFVHASGFIGGCKTYEGALALATKSLDFMSE
jgi:uncharacterized UPF0160 family protein